MDSRVHKLFLKEGGWGSACLLSTSRENPQRGQTSSSAASRSLVSLCRIRKFLSTGAARSSGILFPSCFHPSVCQVFAECLRHQALFEEIGLQYRELVHSSNFMVYTVKLTNSRENSTVLLLKLKKKYYNLMKNKDMTPD